MEKELYISCPEGAPTLRRFMLAGLILVAVLATPGCALLLPAEDSDGIDPNDPVARAALTLRRGPASQGAWTSRAPAASAGQLEFAARNREIVPGMEMNDVRSILGSPRDVETAGDPQQGNERWVYTDGSRGALNHGASRIVYFENGRVAGWKSH